MALPIPPMKPPPRPRLPRLGWLDVVLLAGVVALVGWMTTRAESALSYRWDWSVITAYLVKVDPKTGSLAPNLLLEGLFTTLRLSVWGLLLATIIGTVMGVARTSRRLFPRLVSGAYVMVVRNIPPLVFVFIVVFFVGSQILTPLALGDAAEKASPAVRTWISILFGPPRLVENVLAGLICLGLFSGAYVTEIVRAGIQSIPASQIEAGQSLALRPLQIIRLIVLPQAIRKVLPPLAGQFIQMIKDSSLVALVSVQELSFVAMDIQISTQKVFEVLLFTGGLYFVICFGLSLVFARLEKRGLAARG